MWKESGEEKEKKKLGGRGGVEEGGKAANAREMIDDIYSRTFGWGRICRKRPNYG